MTLANGSYHYYPPLSPIPIVAQIDRDIVWFAGDDQYKWVAKCAGKFVRLVELDDAIAAAVGAAKAPVGAAIDTDAESLIQE